jgi:DNA-binding SARP family transcriptional activator
MSDRFVTAAPARRKSSAANERARRVRRVLRLRLLNGFELRADGAEVRLPMSAQRLVAFVALHEQPQLRVRVAGVLWADVSEERAFASLRSSLWRANRMGAGLIASTGSRLALAPAVHVDLREASAYAQRLLEPNTDDFDAALDTLIQGELLPDWYEDWVLLERERFRQLRLHALEAACERHAKAGQFGLGLACALAAVAAEPLRESAHRAAIRAHLAEGNVYEALRQYRSCRRLLREGLGVSPSTELEELVQNARR